jgi:hypothetical protein
VSRIQGSLSCHRGAHAGGAWIIARREKLLNLANTRPLHLLGAFLRLNCDVGSSALDSDALSLDLLQAILFQLSQVTRRVRSLSGWLHTFVGLISVWTHE